jgi:hypothetical protein
MPIRFIIEHEAAVTRPNWGGRELCLQWGFLTDEEGRPGEKGYRNIWRNEAKRLLTGRAQARIPSKAIQDELWAIAERGGWAHFLGDLADQWQRVTINSGDINILASALMNSYIKAFQEAGCPNDAKVLSNNMPGQEPGDRIYFFSPKAAEIAKNLLTGFSPESCQQPDMGTLRTIRM